MQTAENRTRYLGSFAVAPLAGAWIEIKKGSTYVEAIKSLPSRERGLKFLFVLPLKVLMESLPSRERGLKYLFISSFDFFGKVAPLAGAWIEMVLNSPD